MDYARSLTFIFDDPRWKEKLAWGTGLALVSLLLSPILVGLLGYFILYGYAVRLLQNVRQGEANPLPEWDDWGGDFIRGAKYFVVAIVYSLPIILLSIPVAIGGILADSGGAGDFFGATILLCGYCLMAIYGIFVALVAPGFTIAYSTDENIGSGLQFTKVWNWTYAHIGPVIIVAIVVLVAQLVISLVASLVGAILCLVGLVITIPLSVLVMTIYTYHLYGQLNYQFAYDGTGGIGTTLPASTAYSAPTTDVVAPETPAVDTTPETPTAPDEPTTGDEAPGDSEKNV